MRISKLRPIKSSRASCQSLLFVSIIVVLASQGCECCFDSWQFEPGILIPSGSWLHMLEIPTGVLMALHGAERVSDMQLDSKAIYYVFVITPDVPFRGVGHASSTRCATSTESITWQLGQWLDPNTMGSRSLTIEYQAKQRVIQVGKQSFARADGNLFLVSLDSNWQPATQQIHDVVEDLLEARQALEEFKARVQSNGLVQRAVLAGES